MGIYCINVDNVNQALPQGLRWLTFRGAEEDSRNGIVKVSDTPVMTTYSNPRRRVMFSPLRDANPWFHLFESLWMLAGRKDLPWLARFNKRMAEYSDDGGMTQPAAYGHRWRVHFGYDQLEAIIEELTRFPDSRRAVLAMWNGGGDRDNSILVGVGDMMAALQGSKDVPCNTHVYFRIRAGQLDMTVCCRSNDILWGAYGANAVHFSVLQEYMAARLRCTVGVLYQLSNNFHYYANVIADPLALAADCETSDYYNDKKRLLGYMPITSPDEALAFLPEVERFCEQGIDDPENTYTAPFIQLTVVPMLHAWEAFKAKEHSWAASHSHNIVAPDWRVACQEWLERRALRRRQKETANG